jgi:hypothetical protein
MLPEGELRPALIGDARNSQQRTAFAALNLADRLLPHPRTWISSRRRQQKLHSASGSLRATVDTGDDECQR